MRTKLKGELSMKIDAGKVLKVVCFLGGVVLTQLGNFIDNKEMKEQVAKEVEKQLEEQK